MSTSGRHGKYYGNNSSQSQSSRGSGDQGILMGLIKGQSGKNVSGS